MNTEEKINYMQENFNKYIQLVLEIEKDINKITYLNDSVKFNELYEKRKDLLYRIGNIATEIKKLKGDN